MIYEILQLKKEKTISFFVNLTKTRNINYLIKSLHFIHHVDPFQVGWGYASVTEDILTGMRIHREGWSSVWCGANPPGFLGTVPTSLPVCLLQKKRWTTGLLQVFFSKNNPLFDTLYAKLGFRQSLAYIWILNWGLSSIFDLCYSLLPTYCILTNSNFLPKVHLCFLKF